MVVSSPATTRRTPSAFGQLLKRLRTGADWTQEELAERAGVSARLISDLERGVIQRPRRETVQQLANGLDLSVAERETFAALARGRVATGISPATAVAPRGHLPQSPTPTVGRGEETAAAMALLIDQETRLLTLTGPGGVGKTRLAIDVATKIQLAFPDGVSFIDLAPVRDARLVLQAIAHVVGIKPSWDQTLHDGLVNAMHGQRVLLVLDNVEHVADAGNEIASLLSACDQLTILATSRAPLRLRAEREYRVEPLALPDLDAPTPLAELAQVPAVDLFIRRVSEVNRGFALSATNAQAVAEITVRLDGLPLALELAAARTTVLPPAAMLRRLERRLPLLIGGARDLPARLQAMRAAIDWSYDLLQPDEQRLFRRLSVLVGGFSLDAAEAVSAGEEISSLLDLVASLLDKSLVHRFESNDSGSARFGMLETIREYGLEQLAKSEEEAETRRQHAAWCLDLAERGEPELYGPDQAAWLNTLDREHDNLRAALGWAVAGRDGELAARLGGALYQFWNVRDHYEEGRRWLEQTLGLVADGPPAARAITLLAIGVIAYRQADYDRAMALEDALSLYRELDDTTGVAVSLGSFGKLVQAQGDIERATAMEEQALALFRELGDLPHAHNMLVFLAHAAHDLGDYGRAEALLNEALGLARDLGAPHTIAVSLNQIAIFEIVRGNYDRAQAIEHEVIDLWRQLGYRAGLGLCLENLAWIAARQQRAGRAARLFGALERVKARVGSPGRRVDREVSSRHIAEARAQLGEGAFVEAWEAGRAMSLDEAIAFALEGTDQSRST